MTLASARKLRVSDPGPPLARSGRIKQSLASGGFGSVLAPGVAGASDVLLGIDALEHRQQSEGFYVKPLLFDGGVRPPIAVKDAAARLAALGPAGPTR